MEATTPALSSPTTPEAISNQRRDRDLIDVRSSRTVARLIFMVDRVRG